MVAGVKEMTWGKVSRGGSVRRVGVNQVPIVVLGAIILCACKRM